MLSPLSCSHCYCLCAGIIPLNALASLPSMQWHCFPCCAGIFAIVGLAVLPSLHWRHCHHCNGCHLLKGDLASLPSYLCCSGISWWHCHQQDPSGNHPYKERLCKWLRTPTSEPRWVGITVYCSYRMHMDSISISSNNLYMSNLDVGSSLRWLSTSTMMLWHYFNSTSVTQNPQIWAK